MAADPGWRKPAGAIFTRLRRNFVANAVQGDASQLAHDLLAEAIDLALAGERD
jgi:hypothetical protein